jgi:RNA polymerase sigma-70 factor (ECF subfamily)
VFTNLCDVHFTFGMIRPFCRAMNPQREMHRQFSEAYESYADAIRWHCWFRTMSKEDADELTQETFMKTWEYLQSGRSVENMKAFLYRVANSRLIDAFRRNGASKKDVSLEQLQEQGFDVMHSDIENLQKKLEAWKILLAMDKGDDYELLVMRYLEGLTPADIASIKGISANVISVRIHRALRHIEFVERSKRAKALQKRKMTSGQSIDIRK